MLEFSEKKIFETQTLELNGRIDSLSAPDVFREIESLIQSGERTLIMDCGNLNYISSAGLRVFLKADKLLSQADGRIIFLNMPENCFEVFAMTEFDKLYDFVSSLNDLELLLVGKSTTTIDSKVYGNLECKIRKQDFDPGTFSVIGDESALGGSEFTSDDIVSVDSSDYKFATGIAAAGTEKNEVLELFGECVIINRNIFYYPAMKNSAVDFVFDLDGRVNVKYHFLHGFGFNGNFKYLMNFKSLDSNTSLKEIAGAANEISDSNLTGVVIIAESKGFMGMNIKNIPLKSNKPDNGESIFDDENFFNWFDFPIEPSNFNNLIVSIGVVAKDKNTLKEDVNKVFPRNENFHFHSGIFGNSPLSHQLDSFEKELSRVNMELDVEKVQHTLGQSEFSYGMIGIIELNN